MTDIINIIGNGFYRPEKPPASRLEALLLRKEKFFPPPNAVADKPIDLSRPRGVTGSELIIRRAQEAKERADAVMKAEIERCLSLLRVHAIEAGLLLKSNREEEDAPILLSLPVTISDIKKEVCRQWRISPHELVSRRRGNYAIQSRHLAMMLSKELTKKSLPQIGREFHRHHTTILEATRIYKWLADLLAKEEPKAQTLSELVARAKHHLMNAQKT